MKKFLIGLSVLALISASAFASVTTNTKELSEGNYPGALTKGSLAGTSIFIGDLSTLANTLTLETSYNNYEFDPMGTVVLKTDIGILGVDLGTNNFFDNNTIGLMYGTSLDSMNVGAKLNIGTNGYSYENKNLAINNGNHYSTFNGTTNYDKENDLASTYALQLGASMKNGFDLSLGIAMNNSNINVQELSTFVGVKTVDNTANSSSLMFDLSGRTVIGNGFTTVLGGVFVNNSSEYKNLTFDATGTKTSDTTEKNTSGFFGIQGLVGKDIKATDTLMLKLASGANFTFNPEYNNTIKNNMTGTTTYQTGTKDSGFSISVPLNIAVEAKLNETWSINAGANSTILSTDNTTTRNNALATAENWLNYSTNGTFNIASTMNYSLGVTGKIGDITLDVYMNPEILFYGPNFLSGVDLYSESDVLAYAIALGYSWK
jgi:hypothetical protein